MKVSIFCCMPTHFPSNRKGVKHVRVKITVDTLKQGYTFHPFKGSEHAVCNHKDTCVREEHLAVLETNTYGLLGGASRAAASKLQSASERA